MTERTPDIEARLSAAFARQTLPAAPVSVYRHLEHVVDLAPPTRPRPRRRFVYIGLLLLLIALIWAFAGIILLMSSPAAPPTTQLSPRPTALVSVDGLRVRSVGEVLATRKAGGLRGEQLAMSGYWTFRSRFHSCAPPSPPEQPGTLEHYCHDGEVGITDRPEPIRRWVEANRYVPATGPSVSPHLDEEIWRQDWLFAMQLGRELPPAPIVVTGHFDDPRADECRPDARQLCLDRFVVERVIAYDVGVAWSAVPPIVGASFADRNPPAAPFTADACPEIDNPAFAGWTTRASIGLPDEEGVAWALVSRDDRVVVDWSDGPDESDRQARLMAKWMCAARGSYSALLKGPLVTTLYLEWSDGEVTRIGPHAARGR